MAMSKSNPPEESRGDTSDKVDQSEGGSSEHLLADADEQRVTGEHNPIGLLLALATDDNVETSEGIEVKVANARDSTDNALLTKSELQKYEEYKKQWAASLSKPQESLDALARREQQIIEAARSHDWEMLDRLKKEVDADLEKMQFIYSNIARDMNSL